MEIKVALGIVESVAGATDGDTPFGAAVGTIRAALKKATPSTSTNTGSPKLTTCNDCPLRFICAKAAFDSMACRGARSQLRAGA